MFEEKIKKIYKNLRIAFIVNFAARLLCTIIVGINIALTLSNFIDMPIISKYTNEIICFTLIKLLLPIMCLSELCKREKILSLDNSTDDIELKHLYIVLICCSIIIVGIFIYALILCIVYSLHDIARIIGYTSIGGISFLVAYIMTWFAYVDIKEYRKIEECGSEEAYIESIIQKKENREIALKQREEEKEVQKRKDTAIRLLNDIGTKFYVKYYEKLRDWSIPDIIDEIEENYTEESKIKRIKTAKKLFESDLNLTALEIIVNESDKLTDDKTKEKASTLISLEKQ